LKPQINAFGGYPSTYAAPTPVVVQQQHQHQPQQLQQQYQSVYNVPLPYQAPKQRPEVENFYMHSQPQHVQQVNHVNQPYMNPYGASNFHH